MPHIILVTSGLVGIRNASLELARRLEDAGVRVSYASEADIGELVEAAGVAFLSLDAGDRPPSPQRSGRARLLVAPRVAARRRAQAAAYGVESVLAQLEAADPDLLLIDRELHPLIIAAAGAGLPVALLSVWLATWKRPRVPPLHHALVPTSGRWGALRVEIGWLRYRLWKLGHRWAERIRRAGVDQVSVLRTLSAEHGFPFREEVDLWQWQLPFSYRHLPQLDLTVRELDLPQAAPARVRYAGAMIPPARPQTGDPVEGFLDGRRGTDRALVYVAFGSFYRGNDAPFVRQVLDALEERPDLDVVVALGGRMDPAIFGPLPEHIRIFGWVPQSRVIAESAVAIIHGGIGTINECIRFGVPMLAYPFPTNDQPGTAARIAFHGLGIVGRRDEDAVTILSRLERLLDEAAFQHHVDEMRRVFEAYEREGRAATAIRELLEETRETSDARRRVSRPERPPASPA